MSISLLIKPVLGSSDLSFSTSLVSLVWIYYADLPMHMAPSQYPATEEEKQQVSIMERETKRVTLS